MEPHAVLGVRKGASGEEISASYRRLAKQLHPDRGGAHRRMAEINSAYELLLATAWTRERTEAPQRRRPPRGSWLEPAVRAALGSELIAALEDGERVWIVTPSNTRASPQTLLAVSDRRLLWLRDDVVNGRVQTLRLTAVENVEQRLRPPRRRVASLKVYTRDGSRHVFGGLRPVTAAAISRRIQGV